ncbi:host cell division inhibitor Icd-like protein [Cedecea sp. S5-13]|uniref:host cell division inhibitor Icd-like protein n=1 Tax=Cedecea selenatireducens TaxID=3144416 RepID=UPI0035CCD036
MFCNGKIAKPQSARTLMGLLTKPLTGVTTMAGTQHTQTHPKFTWRFLALDITGSHIIHITAGTESEAREQSPADSLLVFAGRFPERGASHA